MHWLSLLLLPTLLCTRSRLRNYFLSYLNVPVEGIEPPPSWFVAKRSIPLSYTGIGTVDPILRFPIMSHPLTVGQRQHILTPGVGVCRTGVSSNFVGLP